MSWQVDQIDPHCVVIVDEHPRSGQENMELDRQALEYVCRNSVNESQPISICRLYQWITPTVTLGYFQDTNVSVPNTISTCPRVKRLTGGGAILHDSELTYSVAVPAQHSIRHEPLGLYEVIHMAIIRTLAEQNVSSSMRRDSSLFQKGESASSPKESLEPFLCFLRQDDRDIVIGKDKVVGSAQRRRKGSILQHGSVLLRASRLVPNVVGLHDLTREFNSQNFSERLAAAIAESIAPHHEILKSVSGRNRLQQMFSRM